MLPFKICALIPIKLIQGVIYLSCSSGNVQKTAYFYQLDKNRKIFGHFSCCMRDKLIYSLDFMGINAHILIGRMPYLKTTSFFHCVRVSQNFQMDVAGGRRSLRKLKIGENIPLNIFFSLLSYFKMSDNRSTLVYNN